MFKWLIKYKLFIYFLLGVTFSPIRSQDKTTDEVDTSWQLVIKHRVKEDGVYIRWAVNNVDAWQAALKYGFVVERSTISSEKVSITPFPLRPKPESEWQAVVESNDMAAVAAQAIFGENFSVNKEEEGKVMQVINMASELEQRFAFSLYAMDRDFNTALLSGFGLVDHDIVPGETYLYNIKLASPASIDIPELEYGFVAHTDEIEDLPKPHDFVVYYYNDAFLLIWEYDSYLSYYNSYDIERSENGSDFIKINKVPITKLANTSVSGISYTDSIPVYSKKFWYRIKGHSYFDEIGPASDTMSVTAYKELLVAPDITNKEIVSINEVKLKWSFANDEAWKLTDFDLLRADNAIGPYLTVQSNLGLDTRETLYNKLTESNYFKIRAKGIAGDFQDSSPTLIQPIDSVPPGKPVGLLGTVDTLGIVNLKWSANQEIDLNGYFVYRSDTKNQEFTRLNKHQISETSYTDTINIKSFNKEVFYKIEAIDNRYNSSQPSQILTMSRPNRIPPLSPLFTDYEVKMDTVKLFWLPSGSDNIKKQLIYRNTINQRNQWKKIFETDNPSEHTFYDLEIEENVKYTYTVVSVNEYGIESNPSPPVSIVAAKNLTKNAIKGLYAKVDRQLHIIDISWRSNLDNAAELRLYRKTGKAGFKLYKTLPVTSKKFTDDHLKVGSTYGYAIQAIFDDGSTSIWQEVNVKY